MTKKKKKKNAGKPRRRSLLVGITSRTLMIGAALLLVVSNFSFLVNPAKAWIMTIFGICYIPLLILNLILLLWATLRRSKAVLIPLLALIPSIFMTGSSLRLSTKSLESMPENTVKVVSYNVGRFRIGRSGKEKLSPAQCRDSVFSMVSKMNADIICLQEFMVDKNVDIKKLLASKFRGYHIEYYVYGGKSGRYGNVTLSRFPILDKGVVKFENSKNLAIYSDLSIGGERVRLYNCHFQSYALSPARIARSLRSNYRKTLAETQDKMRNSISLRPKQVQQVLRHIESSPVKAMVVGDFNDPPKSYTYTRLVRSRKDSFREAGKGFGSTFSGFGPLLRIDYILVPKSFDIWTHSIEDSSFSDHYPIVARISTPK